MTIDYAEKAEQLGWLTVAELGGSLGKIAVDVASLDRLADEEILLMLRACVPDAKKSVVMQDVYWLRGQGQLPPYSENISDDIRTPAWKLGWSGLFDGNEEKISLMREVAATDQTIKEVVDILDYRVRYDQALIQHKKKSRVTPEIRQRIFARDGHCCQKCGSTDNLTIDHIVPLTRFGPTIDENLQTLCRTCNSRKSNR